MRNLVGLHLSGVCVSHEELRPSGCPRELPGRGAGLEDAGQRALAGRLPERLVAGQRGGEHLRRDAPAEPLVEGAVDNGHAAAGEDLIEPVPGQVISDGEFAGYGRLVAHRTSRSARRRRCPRASLTMYAKPGGPPGTPSSGPPAHAGRPTLTRPGTVQHPAGDRPTPGRGGLVSAPGAGRTASMRPTRSCSARSPPARSSCSPGPDRPDGTASPARSAS